MLYVQTTPPGSNDTIPVFVVPVNRRQLAIDGCHRNAGHQGRDRTLKPDEGAVLVARHEDFLVSGAPELR